MKTNTQAQPTAPQAEDEDVVGITELHEFVPLLEHWHTKQVHILEHLLTVPEGQQVQVGEDETFVLAGECLKGFRLGIQLSLSFLGNLPFIPAPEEDSIH